MTGGARTTAEAVAGLIMHPKDSLEDFKAFFSELGKIWNNGDIGNGLREHGVAASKLLIKYLPLGGAPGFAAAKALETLQVTKWINLLASLIDFVTGKGNIANFFNALKELVGDIFTIIKDFVASLISNPGQITNAVNSAVNVVGQATTALGNEIVGAFDPGFKAQSDAYNQDQAAQSRENSMADQIIQATQEDAQAKFDDDPPKSFDDALKMVLTFSLPNGSYKVEPDPELQDMKGEFLRTETQSSKSGYASGRVRDSVMLYIIPYFKYLRENWAQRPDIYKDKTLIKEFTGRDNIEPLPEIPDWATQQNKLLETSIPNYTNAPKPQAEFATWFNKWKQNAVDITTEDPTKKNVRETGEAQDQQQSFIDQENLRNQDYQEYAAGFSDRFDEARKILLRALGRPVTEKNPAWTGNEGFAQPVTNEDNSFYYKYAGGKVTGEAFPKPHPYSKAELDGFLRTAVKSHKNDPKVVKAPPATAPPAPTPEAPKAQPPLPQEVLDHMARTQASFKPFMPPMAGGSKAFHHLEQHAIRHGKRPRTHMLDPSFFE
jgi:hypothetical protein